ncbi:MAG: hypothetical protein NZ700_00860 [Gemmataceae bacterium]|nr:hypothetical protein [Gemmataceae bacterium]MDW8266379.1 hypothetical protein [Gemmataceae bacterium]
MELCHRVPGLGLTRDPTHYLASPNQGRNYVVVYPYVRHVRLRHSDRRPDQFQVCVGQGEIEHGRVLNQLTRFHYDRSLSADIRDIPNARSPWNQKSANSSTCSKVLFDRDWAKPAAGPAGLADPSVRS